MKPASAAPDKEPSLEALVERRVEFLTAYQNRAYADRYRALVDAVAKAEAAKAPGRTGLATAVARYLFKLMAYKDEYEVARLYTDGSFRDQVARTFEGDLRFEFHLAPPLLARKDAVTGEAKKMRFGPWMMQGFRALAALRGLRGTRFDIFGYTAERREERALIGEYEALCRELIATLTSDNHPLAVSLASLPEKIRGYGHVKMRNLAETREGMGAADRDMARAGAEAAGGGVRRGRVAPAARRHCERSEAIHRSTRRSRSELATTVRVANCFHWTRARGERTTNSMGLRQLNRGFLRLRLAMTRPRISLCPAHAPGAERPHRTIGKPSSIACARCRRPPWRSCKSITTSS